MCTDCADYDLIAKAAASRPERHRPGRTGGRQLLRPPRRAPRRPRRERRVLHKLKQLIYSGIHVFSDRVIATPRNSTRAGLVLTSVSLLVLLLNTPGNAQVLQGTITDRVSGEPIPASMVLVLNPDSAVRAATVADGKGDFRMLPEAGPFLLRVERLGYRTVWSQPLELAASDSLGFEIRLAPQPVQLDSLAVVAERSRFDPSGFYSRQRWGWGRFLGPEEVERRRPIFVGDLLTHIPGFSLYNDMGGTRVAMTGRGRHCRPTVYLDRHLVSRGSSTSRSGRGPPTGVILDELVNVRRIRAVEVYQTGVEAPPGFHPVTAGGGGDCGVIALWTYVGFGR